MSAVATLVQNLARGVLLCLAVALLPPGFCSADVSSNGFPTVDRHRIAAVALHAVLHEMRSVHVDELAFDCIEYHYEVSDFDGSVEEVFEVQFPIVATRFSQEAKGVTTVGSEYVDVKLYKDARPDRAVVSRKRGALTTQDPRPDVALERLGSNMLTEALQAALLNVDDMTGTERSEVEDMARVAITAAMPDIATGDLQLSSINYFTDALSSTVYERTEYVAVVFVVKSSFRRGVSDTGVITQGDKAMAILWNLPSRRREVSVYHESTEFDKSGRQTGRRSKQYRSVTDRGDAEGGEPNPPEE